MSNRLELAKRLMLRVAWGVKVVPRGSDSPLPPLEYENIGADDAERASDVWDEVMSDEFPGLLDAEITI